MDNLEPAITANFGHQLLHLIKQKSYEQMETSDARFADTEPS